MNNDITTLTEKEISDIFFNLSIATTQYHLASEELIYARQKYETAKAEKTQAGLIEGKNEDQRKASAKTVLADELEELRKAEDEERTKRFQLDCANMALDKAKLILRLAEVQAGHVSSQHVFVVTVPAGDFTKPLSNPL